MTGEEALRVLKMVEAGIISAREGERLLQVLSGAADEQPAMAPAAAASPRRLARYPLIAGSLLAGFGAVVVAADYAGAGGGRVLGYLALGLGSLAVLVGLFLARALWVHVHVSKGRREHPIDVALPVPLTLAAWAVRLARPHMRGFDATGLDEVILSLGECARQGQALSLDVDQGDGGERIRVSIG